MLASVSLQGQTSRSGASPSTCGSTERNAPPTRTGCALGRPGGTSGGWSPRRRDSTIRGRVFPSFDLLCPFCRLLGRLQDLPARGLPDCLFPLTEGRPPFTARATIWVRAAMNTGSERTASASARARGINWKALSISLASRAAMTCTCSPKRRLAASASLTI